MTNTEKNALLSAAMRIQEPSEKNDVTIEGDGWELLHIHALPLVERQTVFGFVRLTVGDHHVLQFRTTPEGAVYNVTFTGGLDAHLDAATVVLRAFGYTQAPTVDPNSKE